VVFAFPPGLMEIFALALISAVGVLILWGWYGSYKYDKRRDRRKF
jgi:uncharacterized membrane protein SpoIIM required for sporulation